MLSNLTYFFIIFYFYIATLVNSYNINSSGKIHSLLKRDEDLQTCLDNFDIHPDKIIRTQDSKAMGAKFLNERDLSSREDCLRFCCETVNCDVFVFEEKNPGSCYLFECGSPEDFKCKFTKHKNYTSAVLASNRHLTELESQIKFTQHEHELSKLREPDQDKVALILKTTTEVPLNKESVQLVPVSKTSNNDVKNTKCSIYQFTCHSSGECIAIYNACDGIAQCSDGSDEAPELGCPGQTSTVAPKAISVKNSDLRQEKLEETGNNNYIQSGRQYQQNHENSARHQWPQQQQPIREHPEIDILPGQNNIPIGSQHQVGASQISRVNYGREGEGVSSYNGEQPWSYQYLPSNGGSQIFNHKGNGLIQQSDRYQHSFNPMDPVGGSSSQFSGRLPNDFIKYNYPENVGYRRFPQGAQSNNWEVQKEHDPQINQPDDISSNGDRAHNNNMNPPDYYYEDFYRRGSPQNAGRFSFQTSNFQQPLQSHNQDHQDMIKTNQEKIQVGKDEGAKFIASSTSETITSSKTIPTTLSHKAADHIHIPIAHRKMEKLSADVTIRESSFSDSEMDGHSTSPSGAILSLTFGLCITGIMIVLVGCRMRMVHRRMRRGGKSPYAHDADFLVNGMYL